MGSVDLVTLVVADIAVAEAPYAAAFEVGATVLRTQGSRPVQSAAVACWAVASAARRGATVEAAGCVSRTSARLRDVAAGGGSAFGLWSSLSDPGVAELLAATDYDYVCVDLQHGQATFAELPGIVLAMRAAGRAPIVRVPWNEPVAIMRALDTGAAGVVVPMVNSAAQAAVAASACRFPPVGTRSWGPMWGWTRPDGALPPAEQDAGVLCLVMIETAAAVEALPAILDTPGVDGVYVGPNDLALSCGFGRGTYRDTPQVDDLLMSIVGQCRSRGLLAGVHCSDVAMAREWAGRGATMATSGQDTALLRAMVDQEWAQLHAEPDEVGEAPVRGRGY